MVEKQKCKVMQIKCLDQDLRVPDLRLHQWRFLEESTADQTRLIDERNPGKEIQREIDRLLRTSSTLSLKIDRFSYAES